MNTTTQASRFIPITNPDLRFMGRIDRTPADHQTWAFPYTQVSFRCTGTSIGVRLVNHWGYGDAYLGAIIDPLSLLQPFFLCSTPPENKSEVFSFIHIDNI